MLPLRSFSQAKAQHWIAKRSCWCKDLLFKIYIVRFFSAEKQASTSNWSFFFYCPFTNKIIKLPEELSMAEHFDERMLFTTSPSSAVCDICVEMHGFQKLNNCPCIDGLFEKDSYILLPIKCCLTSIFNNRVGNKYTYEAVAPEATNHQRPCN